MEIEYENEDERSQINDEEEDETSYARRNRDAEDNDEEEAEVGQEGEDGEEGVGDGEEEEETIGQPDEPKKKKPFKARQSLAEKAVGTTIFPISRVKRIIKADKELDMMTGEATFLISVATEYFIKHFMEEGYTKARLEKRRIVNYKDMASVVARSSEFEFLRDVVPTPISLSAALQLRKEKLGNDEHPEEPADDPAEETLVSSTLTDQLPPLSLSTNPLFPNAIVKKSTKVQVAEKHQEELEALHLQDVEDADREKERKRVAEIDTEKETETEEMLDEVNEMENERDEGELKEDKEKIDEIEKEQSKQKPIAIQKRKASAHLPPTPTTPRIPSGKNAPSTPHSFGTRRSARRSIASQDVNQPAEENDAMDED